MKEKFLFACDRCATANILLESGANDRIEKNKWFEYWNIWRGWDEDMEWIPLRCDKDRFDLNFGTD